MAKAKKEVVQPVEEPVEKKVEEAPVEKAEAVLLNSKTLSGGKALFLYQKGKKFEIRNQRDQLVAAETEQVKAEKLFADLCRF